MKNNCSHYKILLMILIFAILPLISSLETAQISYIQRVDFIPYCTNNCTSTIQLINSSINQTLNTTSCIERCYANINISIRFPGDDTWRIPYFIDTGNILYTEAHTFENAGTYITTFGNSSDVTGLNDKIVNLTSTINNDLVGCFNDKFLIQNNASLSQQICTSNIDSLNVALSTKNNDYITADKKANQRLWYAIGGVILGILLIKFGEPYIKGRVPKKDPNEEGFSAYEGRY